MTCDTVKGSVTKAVLCVLTPDNNLADYPVNSRFTQL